MSVYEQKYRRRGILCPKCGMHQMRTMETCAEIAEKLKADPDWRATVDRWTLHLALPKDCTMEDLARGYVLENP